MKRFLQCLSVVALAIATPAFAAADKPLVIEAGKTKQLPASTTLQVNASGTGAASINIPHGTAPTAPTDGDCWTTTTGLFCRVNGATVGPYGTGSGSAITSKDEGSTLTTGTTSFDFVGPGVTASNTGGAVTVTVPGGGATTNALTITNTGGASPGATFDGSIAKTIDYSTVGAAKTGAVTGSNLTMATSRLLGRTTASTGAIEEITVGSGLTLSAGSLSASGGGIGSSADLMQGQVQYLLPRYQDTTPDAFGGVVTLTQNVVSAAYATTNMATRRVRVGLNHNAANTVGYVKTNGTKGTVVGGTSQFRERTRWSIVTGPSTLVCLAGSQGSWAPGTVTDPSGATNILGVGWDAADTNLQVMHNDGSGTATKVDLGSNFPARTVGAYYEAKFEADGSGTVTYTVRRFDSAQTATGSFSTDMPVEDGYRSGLVCGVSSAQAWQVDFHGWGFEQNQVLGY